MVWKMNLSFQSFLLNAMLNLAKLQKRTINIKCPLNYQIHHLKLRLSAANCSRTDLLFGGRVVKEHSLPEMQPLNLGNFTA